VNTTPNTQEQQPMVPAIEQALDSLCTAVPKKNETLLKFATRCVQVIQGSKQRKQLLRAIIDTANEFGLRALDPALQLQRVLQELNAAAAAETPEAPATEAAQ
jgi:hypothetical protein